MEAAIQATIQFMEAQLQHVQAGPAVGAQDVNLPGIKSSRTEELAINRKSYAVDIAINSLQPDPAEFRLIATTLGEKGLKTSRILQQWSDKLLEVLSTVRC